jgi:hypothetical protein
MVRVGAKIKRVIPNKLRRRRVGYFAMALVIFLSAVSYTLIFKPAPKVKAATITATADQSGSGINRQQSHVVVTSNGVIVAFTASSTALRAQYSVSTNNGSNWSAATTLDTGGDGTDLSAAIDSSDNIYVAYRDNLATNNTYGIQIRKMSPTNGIPDTSWTVGSATTVYTHGSCVVGPQTDGELTYSNPSVSINSDNKIFVHAIETMLDAASCGGSVYSDLISRYSTNGTIWTSGSSAIVTSLTNWPIASVADGKTIWMESSGNLYADIAGTGSVTYVTSIGSNVRFSSPISMTYGMDRLHFFYRTGSTTLEYAYYDIATGSMSATTTISSATPLIYGRFIRPMWALAHIT